MNKFLIPDPSNGIRQFWEEFEYVLGLNTIDSGIIQAIEGILNVFGTDFIVQGCEDLGSSVTADGWILLGGNLIRVKQHTRTNTYFAAITETNTTGDRTDNLGSLINIYEQNRATSSSASGNLAYNGLRLEDILGRTSETLAITSGSINTLTDLQRYVTITSASLSVTTINVPNAAIKNKGVIISFNINCGCILTLNLLTISTYSIIFLSIILSS